MEIKVHFYHFRYFPRLLILAANREKYPFIST